MVLERREGRKGGTEWREERKGKREKHINVRDKHLLVAFRRLPDQGLNPQPRHVP